MSKQEQLQELLARYGLSPESSLRDFLELEKKPEQYAAFKAEFCQIVGIDPTEDIADKLLNDPEIQQVIEESARREAGI